MLIYTTSLSYSCIVGELCPGMLSGWGVCHKYLGTDVDVVVDVVVVVVGLSADIHH